MHHHSVTDTVVQTAVDTANSMSVYIAPSYLYVWCGFAAGVIFVLAIWLIVTLIKENKQ